jgi:predicted nucleic acid-binding Zn finger protein
MSTDHTDGVPARYAALTARTRRALAEQMNITTHGPGIYRVESQSGAAYIVDLPSRTDNATDRSSATCTCPDYRTSTQEDDCKHIRCVKLDIAFGNLPEPEETPTEGDHVKHEAVTSTGAAQPGTASVATDGGAVKSKGDSADRRKSNIPSNDAPEPPSGPDIESTVPSPATQESIYQQIATRIREIEAEIDQRHAELQDLETTLSVFEEFQKE